MKRTVVSNPERKAMRALREQGSSIRQIQAKFPHWSRWTVQLHVKGIRAPHRVTPEQRASMRAMRASGMSVEAINFNFPQFGYLAIRKHVRDVPLAFPLRRRRRVDPDAVLRLREEHGLKFKAIGERFGVTGVAAFYAYRQARGGVLPPKPVRAERRAGQGPAKGEANGWSKLTADDIRRIRASSLSSGAVAGEFGVSSRAIRLVRQGLTWGHVA
jgi:hypothetical protein